jgi:hypothetical protein
MSPAPQDVTDNGVNSAPSNDCAPSAQKAKAPTNAELAKLAMVSIRTIVRVKQLMRAGLMDAVSSGRLSRKYAVAIAGLPEQERAAAIADPNWRPPKKLTKADRRIAALEAEVERLRIELQAARNGPISPEPASGQGAQ